MSDMQKRKSSVFRCLLWLLEGIIVGFGAILPGVSGGTLCAAFGMYRPAVETVAHIRAGLKKYGLMLGIFLAGVVIGFVGLSGLAAWLMDKNTEMMTCVFIGLILGTLPQLWLEAGAQGRGKRGYLSLTVCFAGMLGVLMLLKMQMNISIAPGVPGYLLCGVFWGLSFIVPGLSSSSLLLFFGLYQPMMEGIAALDMAVLIPMGIGMAASVLALARIAQLAYEKQYSMVSHGVLGIVAATAVMLLPGWSGSAASIALNLLVIGCGAAASYGFTRVCHKLENQSK